jgi:hypothetical protein
MYFFVGWQLALTSGCWYIVEVKMHLCCELWRGERGKCGVIPQNQLWLPVRELLDRRWKEQARLVYSKSDIGERSQSVRLLSLLKPCCPPPIDFSLIQLRSRMCWVTVLAVWHLHPFKYCLYGVVFCHMVAYASSILKYMIPIFWNF